MANQMLLIAALLWILAAVTALANAERISRLALVAGSLLAIAAALIALPQPTQDVATPLQFAGEVVHFRLEPQALWLMGFGLVPAVFACWLASPTRAGRQGWLFGAAISLLGALGVFGVQNGAGMLIAWEAMSLGGAVMIIADNLDAARGRTVLFMLALLEVGAVALVIAVALLGTHGSGLTFYRFAATEDLSQTMQIGIGVLFLIGFGAKLGLLPFYEWFPGAYGSGSGASGTIMSGVVMNAAFFALSRALLNWLPPAPDGSFPMLSAIVIVVATLSAILTILYAFQQDDWRRLLSFSSAENAAIAVMALGSAMLFRSYRLTDLAGLAWTVALLHLAGHALAKGTLFLAADGLHRFNRGYHIAYAGAGNHPLFGIGALLAGMSLAAMPPTAGFVSEWFVFQTVFQGFHLPTLGGRLILALTGAGLALTAAVAFASFVKIIGLGVLSRDMTTSFPPLRKTYSIAVALLGLAVVALGVGMPLWLTALTVAAFSQFGVAVPTQMHDGLLLVPLTAKFAFISPSLLIIVMPLLAVVPIALVLLNRRYPLRRAPVWYGGLSPDPAYASTTSLSFSNAMRTFYSFVYRPTADTERDADAEGYFVKKLVFEHDVAPLFGPLLFQPAVRIVGYAASKLRALQSGHLNFYLSQIGLLLVLILGLTLS